MDSDLEDIYVINGVPMSKSILIEQANSLPSQTMLQYAQAAGEVMTAQQQPQLPQVSYQQSTDTTMLDELKTWRKVAKANPHRDFTCYKVPTHIERYIKARVDDGHDLLTTIDSVIDEVKASGDIAGVISEDMFIDLVNLWDELGLNDLTGDVEDVAGDDSNV